MYLLRYHSEVPNFGDDLNSILWSSLLPSFFTQADEGGEVAMVGIGTVIGIDPKQFRHLHVFSSGAGYTSVDRWKNARVEYHCVRGPLTTEILGLDRRSALTDGAILTPFIMKPGGGGGSTGTIVIPHYETLSYPGWEEAVAMSGFRLVDPRRPPDVVIGEIARADHVLTESLHGAILADTYGIPWTAFSVSRNFSKAKWTDWTSSVEVEAGAVIIPPPDALQLLDHGKPAAAIGEYMPFDFEAALGEFTSRIDPVHRRHLLKEKAKQLLKALPVARRSLGFSSERTAEALAGLKTHKPCLSRAAKRDELQDAMLTRLAALGKRYGASLHLPCEPESAAGGGLRENVAV